MKKFASCTLLAILFFSMFTLAFITGSVKAQTKTIYINANGSTTPSTANITAHDNIARA